MAKLVRYDQAIDFSWGADAPAENLPADGFSVRWTRDVRLDQGRYRVHAVVDDGVRLYIDGALVIDSYSLGSAGSVVAAPVE